MNADQKPETSKRRFTEWHVLTFQEQCFAKTHTEWVARALGMEGKLIPAVQQEIEDEVRNLLFIHRGAAIAAWLMEQASRADAIPGFNGQPGDLKPGPSEKMHMAHNAVEQQERKRRARDMGQKLESVCPACGHVFKHGADPVDGTIICPACAKSFPME